MGLRIFDQGDNEAHWQPEPFGRGTSAILQVYIITLGLCVYSAIHLNIPPRNQTMWHHFWVKGLWITIALLTPEVVVFMAWFQRLEAKAVLKDLCKARGFHLPQPRYSLWWKWLRLWSKRHRPLTRHPPSKADEETSDSDQSSKKGKENDQSPFTLVHGFYLCMGGMAFNTENDSGLMWPSGAKDFTLTSKTIRWLLDNEEYEQIVCPPCLQTIKDRSKANGLIKGLACIQASWFCLEFLTRIRLGLSISLLELNTFAHSICAVVMYILWWHKPLDIAESSRLCTRGGQQKKLLARRICAKLGLQHRFGTYFVPSEYKKGKEQAHGRWKSTLEALNLRDCDVFEERVADTSPDGNNVILSSSVSERLHEPSLPIRRLGATTPRDLHSGAADVASDNVLTYGSRVQDTEYYVHVSSCEIDPTVLQRLKLADAVKERAERPFPRDEVLRNSISNLLHLLPPNGFLDHPELKDVVLNGLNIIVGLFLASLFYGGLHALAYDSNFRSQTETILWAISCLTILCFAPAVVLLLLLYRCLGRGRQVWAPEKPLGRRGWMSTRSLIGLLVSVLHYANIVLIGLGACVYLIGRVFIMVEVFLSLPYADHSIYITPNWTLYFPHIG